MEHVLVIIGNPVEQMLSEIHIENVRRNLSDIGTDTTSPKWLAKKIAVEIPVFWTEKTSEAERMHLALNNLPVDYAVISTKGRRKRLLIADMDSTIIDCECIDELADFAGVKAKVAAITERAMRGDLDFKAALAERVAMLAGLSEDILEKTFRERVRLTPGARTLVQTMRNHDAYAALVSGGFTYFTNRVRDACGFNYDQANVLLQKNGTLTGEVQNPILDGDAKLAALIRLSVENVIPLEQTLAVGDGANDLPMIQASGLGVAYKAKPKVAASAKVRINHADLTALLYLQGYHRDEFATNVGKSPF